MDTFIYQRLDLKSSAFRLVRLLKGTRHACIDCELIATTLDENVIPYEAVSYTWGSLVKSSNIRLQGQNFMVTPSLWDLLRSIRQTEEDRYIWVDAIAINQDDDLERGHQVQRMKSIYSGAERVLFYLGEETASIRILMKSLSALQRHVSGGHWASGDDRWRTAWETVQNEFQLCHDCFGEDIQRQGLEELLKRPWFRRVWILQEVANARRALICCGTASVRVQIFAMAPIFLGVDLDDHVAAIFELMPTFFDRRLRKPRDGALCSVLLDFRWSQASDPRDKIFALLGLCNDHHGVGKGIIPDYTLAESDIVRDTIIHILTGGLDQPLDWIQSVYFPDVDEFLHNLAPSSRKALVYMEKFLIHILSFWNTEAAQSFFSRKENPIKVSREMVNAAASNKYNSVGILIILLRHSELGAVFRNGDFKEQRDSWVEIFNCFFNRFRAVGVLSVQPRDEMAVLVQQEDLYRLLFFVPRDCLGAFTLRLKGEDFKTVQLLNKLQRKMEQAHDTRGKPWRELRSPQPSNQQQLSAVDRREIAQIFLGNRAHTETEVWRMLWMAVPKGETDIVKLLLEMKPEVLNDRQSTNNIFHFVMDLHCRFTKGASYIGESIIRCLLDKGGKITLDIGSPLSRALKLNHSLVVRLFHAYSVNAVGYDGWIPLHYAAKLGDIHAIQFLLEQGADPSAVDENGRTALQVARDNGQDSKILQLLWEMPRLEKTPSINSTTKSNNSNTSSGIIRA